MKCKHVQQRLLATSGPRRLSDEVLAHLDGCEVCRRWSERLRQIDHAVPQLRVPDSSAAKAALLERFLAPPEPQNQPVWQQMRITWAHIAATVAALLLVAVIVRGVFTTAGSSKVADPPDRLLADVLMRNLELATAESQSQRVAILANLADDLGRQTQSLATVAPADDLNTLADLYVSVIGNEHKGLLAGADNLPQAERLKMMGDLAERLRLTAEEAEKQARSVPPAGIEPLQKIATAARGAHGILSRKVREEKLALQRVRDEQLAQDVPPRPRESKS